MHPRINELNDAFLATGEGTAKEVLEFKVGIEPTAFVTAVGFGSSFKKGIPSALRVSCGSVIRAPDRRNAGRVFDCHLELWHLFRSSVVAKQQVLTKLTLDSTRGKLRQPYYSFVLFSL